MAYEVKLTTDGLLINWLRDVGENVSASDVIAEVKRTRRQSRSRLAATAHCWSCARNRATRSARVTVIAVIGAAGEIVASEAECRAAAGEATRTGAGSPIPMASR